MASLTRKQMIIVGAVAVVLLSVALFFVFKEEDKHSSKQTSTKSKNLNVKSALSPRNIVTSGYNNLCNAECIQRVPPCGNQLTTMMEVVDLQYAH